MTLDVTVFGERMPGEGIARLIRAGAAAKELPGRALRLQCVYLDQLASAPVRPDGKADVLTLAFWPPYIHVGPRERIGSRGCSACLLERLAGTRYGPALDPDGTVRQGIPARPPPLLGPGRIATLAMLVETLWGAPPDAPPEIFVLDTRSGAVTREHLLPVAECPVCGPDPTRTAPRLLTDGTDLPGTGRRPAAELGPRLDDIYTPRHVGPVRELLQDLYSIAATTTAEVRHGRLRAEATLGRASDVASSRAIAILEAMERYCGLRTDVLPSAERANYRHVADRALDPRSLGLYEPESYRLHDFPFLPFDADRPLAWVPGHSFARGGPLLVPAAAAFYGLAVTMDAAILGESSNGCALGASLEDAAFHAAFELVERDAFLMAWYRRLRLPELAPESLPGRVGLLHAKAELMTGFGIRLFVSTMEHGLPSVIAVGESRQAGGPRVLVSAGAHPRLEIATQSAIHELAGLILRVQHRFESRRAAASAMLDEPDLVRTIEDHPMAACLPQARSRFDFLLDGTPPLLRFSDVPPSVDLVEGTDRTRLSALVGRLRSVGLDLIVVDQSCSELRPLGLHCVKAIVPGLLPMTFGHRFRRIGLPRLHEAVGYSEAPHPVKPGDWPHPFP